MSDAASELLPLYRKMLLIRRIEEESARAYVEGKIGGFLHLYIGQEAVAVGTEAAIRSSDYVMTTYRDHGHALARGMSARSVMAELFGKDTGCSRGLGGSMHMFDAERRFMGGHGIVGGHVAVAAGLAFKSKYLGEEDVSLCFFGEGATNIGGFHEGLSLAGLWKLPAVFVCENNMYSMGTPLVRSLPSEDLTKKAPGYGLHGMRLEGHDVLEVKTKIGEAVERARNGEGGTLVEILTYRFRGHSMSDPGRYRASSEVEERKRAHDPLRIARAKLLELGASEAAVEALDAEVEEEVQDAVRFAHESEMAKAEVMHEAVLAPSSAWPREEG